ncbi:MAG: hypothetical protein R2792_09525 [Saprospiraceae bacterium]
MDTKIILIAPTDQEETHFRNIAFQWEDPEGSTDFRFRIAQDEYFNNVVFDTTLNQAELLYSESLDLEKKYYWNVSTDNDTRSTGGTFSTRSISGTYVANIHQRTSCMGLGVLTDTSFSGNLHIQKYGNDEFRIDQYFTGLYGIFSLSTFNSSGNKLFYIAENPGSEGITATFNFDTDSIYIERIAGGLGCPTTYKYWAKFE